ncbi:MAG: serine/threonine-protein kinase [Planctomycetes bacterium]|nr:serine/threonine-protein kinase [Planctomycetota bacterium]
MDHERLQQIEELFNAVAERAPADRAAYLQEACAGDARLRAEIDSLLVADSAAGDFMGTPAVGPGALLSQQVLSLANVAADTRIGAYRIVRTIAVGGMGTVYEAIQDHPQRTVALKVIRAGVASPSALRRFQHEAELLGRLSHPEIARVYEAGTYATSPDENDTRPFFAMEYVEEAEIITEYADRAGLDTGARLALLLKVCDATHYAHQRGVIHRDLKPANVLVDRSGQPRIIDFGVARLTESDRQITTMRTDVGQLIGTIPYMSPEQVTGDPSALDVRSDVYALGVLGFELLTGQLPYEVTGRAIPDALRLILNEEPKKPSALNRTLRGDIETILSKALEKEKQRRYGSAAELAADIRRHLRDVPIEARPTSTLYQFRKFARRNQAGVIGAAVAVGGLLFGTAFATWKAFEATSERNRARTAEQNANQQAATARLEAQKAERINQFLQEMLAAADPSTARGREVSVRETLDRAAERIETGLADEPLVAAALRHTIGLTYRNLGIYDQAEAQLRAALDLRRAHLGDDHPDTLRSLSAVATVCRDQGRLADAEDLIRQTLERSQRVLGDTHPDTLSALNLLALVLQDRGALADAEPLYRRVLELQRQTAGPEDPGTLLAVNNLAWLLLSQGRLSEASALFADTLDIRRRVSGDDHPETLRTMINLANVLRELGRPQEAEPLALEAVATCRRVLGDEHALTQYALDRLVWVHYANGNLAEAEALARTALDLRRRALGPKHMHTLHSMSTLAAILSARGSWDAAIEWHRATLAARRQLVGDEHPDTLVSLTGLGTALAQRGDYEQAEPLLRSALEARRRLNGAAHPETLGIMHNLALVLEARGEYTEAERLFREVRTARAAALGDQHAGTLEVTHGLARTLLAQNRAADAEPLLRELVAAADRAVPAGHWQAATFRADLGRCLIALERYAEAEPLLVDSYADLKTSVGVTHKHTRAALASLIRLYEAWGRPVEAAACRAQLAGADEELRGERE